MSPETSSATVMVPITMLGWIPVVVGLFMLLPARRAVITAFLVAWLLLPVAEYSIAGLPDCTKMSATSIGVLLGAVLFDAPRLLSFRPRWADLPTAAWVLVPFATSLSLGLGVYDGISASLDSLIAWGLPYLIGRIYFQDLESLRELAVGIFIGGLAYVPLCLFEIRMSPQLHSWVYGYHQHAFDQTKRWGGFRPTVFMEHGLMVGLWMSATALVGAWLWWTGALRRLVGIPMSVLVPVHMATTILCRSTGALALLAAGLACLLAMHLLRRPAIILGAVLVPPVFIAARIGGWEADSVVAAAASVSPERAQSLKARIDYEQMILEKAAQRPLLGWDGWGQHLVYDRRNRQIAIADSLWIIALAKYGLIGLAACFSALLVPVARVLLRTEGGILRSCSGAPAVALAGALFLYACDKLLNAMPNPVLVMAAGALSGGKWGHSSFPPQPGPHGAWPSTRK